MSEIIIVSPSQYDASPIVWHRSNGTFEEVAKYFKVLNVEEKHWIGIQNFVSILINEFTLTISNAKIIMNLMKRDVLLAIL
jgi:hypothetical protein